MPTEISSAFNKKSGVNNSAARKHQRDDVYRTNSAALLEADSGTAVACRRLSADVASAWVK